MKPKIVFTTKHFRNKKTIYRLFKHREATPDELLEEIKKGQFDLDKPIYINVSQLISVKPDINSPFEGEYLDPETLDVCYGPIKCVIGVKYIISQP